MPDIASYSVYFGSRKPQPARARAFADLAVERLTNCPQYTLTSKELVRSNKSGSQIFANEAQCSLHRRIGTEYAVDRCVEGQKIALVFEHKSLPTGTAYRVGVELGMAAYVEQMVQQTGVTLWGRSRHILVIRRCPEKSC